MLQNNSRQDLKNFQAQTYCFADKVKPQNMENLGDLIQRRMDAVGIASKSELARRIGKSSAYVGDLINSTAKTKSGTYLPSPEVVKKLSKVLNISDIEILESVGYVSSPKIASYEITNGIRLQIDQNIRFSAEYLNVIIQSLKLMIKGMKRIPQTTFQSNIRESEMQFEFMEIEQREETKLKKTG